MDIGYFIGDLLREHDEVSVPGLGTFFKVRVPGTFDPGSSRFFPPSYQLAFKKQAGNHQTLAAFISKQKNLSKSSAEYFVKKFASTVYDILQDTGIAEIKPLGMMYKRNEELSFENNGNYAFSDTFFGLKPVDFSPLVLRPAAASAPEPVETEAESLLEPTGYVSSPIEDFITGAGAPDDYTIPATKLTEEEVELADSTPARFSPLLAAAVVMALLVLTAFMLYRYNPSVQQWVENYRTAGASAEQEPVKTEQPPLVDTMDTITDTTAASALQDSSAMGRSASEELSTTGQLTAENAAPEEPAYVYEIVVATFGRKADAEVYIRQLAAKKISAHIASNIPGPKIKVSVASIKDKAAADKEFARVRKELNEEAWMQLVPEKKNQ